MKEQRSVPFERNKSLENLLIDINSSLSMTEQQLLNNYSENYKDFPIIFIVGPLRSGTTLMMQWLANTKAFAYPTNLLSRFYASPIIGSKIQLLLTDENYNFRNEILDFNSTVDFISQNGKTHGALSPNEFWYFWRFFLPFKNNKILESSVLENSKNKNLFKDELLGVANVFQKPFALKALICNYNIDFLNKLFPKALFIYTHREPISNIISVYEARERQFGNTKTWYSFEIPEYDQLKEKTSIEQIAGQIYFNNRAVKRGLEQVSESKKVIVEYEKFCTNPKYYYNVIESKLRSLDFEIPTKYTGPESFKIRRYDEHSLYRDAIKSYKEFIS